MFLLDFNSFPLAVHSHFYSLYKTSFDPTKLILLGKPLKLILPGQYKLHPNSKTWISQLNELPVYLNPQF